MQGNIAWGAAGGRQQWQCNLYCLGGRAGGPTSGCRSLQAYTPSASARHLGQHTGGHPGTGRHRHHVQRCGREEKYHAEGAAAGSLLPATQYSSCTPFKGAAGGLPPVGPPAYIQQDPPAAQGRAVLCEPAFTSITAARRHLWSAGLCCIHVARAGTPPYS